MRATRTGGPVGPVAALVAVVLAAACLSAGSAWAATQNSVSASGPKQVKVGQQVKLHFTGYATASVTRLRVWLDDQRCAPTARAEGTRANLNSPTNFPVHGAFRARLTVQSSAKGTHVACAYLIDTRTGGTAATASWRYVTS